MGMGEPTESGEVIEESCHGPCSMCWGELERRISVDPSILPKRIRAIAEPVGHSAGLNGEHAAREEG